MTSTSTSLIYLFINLRSFIFKWVLVQIDFEEEIKNRSKTGPRYLTITDRPKINKKSLVLVWLNYGIQMRIKYRNPIIHNNGFYYVFKAE